MTDKWLHASIGFGLAMTLSLVTTPRWTVTVGVVVASAREVVRPNRQTRETALDITATMGGVLAGIATHHALTR